MYYIGVDLGTSAVKLLLMEGNGKICNIVSNEYPLSFPQPGWSEQKPEDWWDAVVDGIQSENFEKNVEDTEEYSGSDNPIDKYFTPKLKSWDISEVEFRENREAYKKAWKAEYKNVMKSLKKKCVYAEDKRNINSLEKNIEQQIKVEKKVLKTELTEAYETNPDSSKVKNDFSRIL